MLDDDIDQDDDGWLEADRDPESVRQELARREPGFDREELGEQFQFDSESDSDSDDDDQ